MSSRENVGIWCERMRSGLTFFSPSIIPSQGTGLNPGGTKPPRQRVTQLPREREREREGEMAWWNKKVVFPVKRALVAVAARVKARKHGDGISKLHDDVQTCGYQDVQVMWEMLRRSETELPKQRKRRFWRPSASSRRTTSCDSMERASSSPR
ncbi:uncharacterized protein LOC135606712 [Musa acuminata AAA Group]